MRCGDNCTIGSVEVFTSAGVQPSNGIPTQKWNVVKQSDKALSEEQQLKLYNLLGCAELFAMDENQLSHSHHKYKELFTHPAACPRDATLPER